MKNPLKIVLLLFLCTAAFANVPRVMISPEFQSGVVQIDDSPDGLLMLHGDWELYFDTLIDPGAFAGGELPAGALHCKVPGAWSWIKGDSIKLPTMGYGTYHLRIESVRSHTNMGIEIWRINSAYRLFVNGELRFQVGYLSPNPGSEIPQWWPEIIPLGDLGKTTDIVIHVSNFHQNMGGITEKVFFGSMNNLIAYDNHQRTIIFLLLGIFIIMLLYHLVLFALRPKDKSTLYFALICLVGIVRILLLSKSFALDYFPNISFEWRYKLIWWSLYLGVPLMMSFVHNIYKDLFNKYMLSVLQAVGIGLSIIVLVTTTRIYTYTQMYFQILMIVYFIYAFGVILRAMFRQRFGAWLMALGFAALLITGINDVLYDMNIIHTGNYVPVGMMIFAFAHAVLIAARFSQAYHIVEDQSAELELMNLALVTENEQRKKARAELERMHETYKKSQIVLMQNERMSAMGIMAAGIAHELNNPIMGIINIAHYCKLKFMPEDEIYELLDSVEDHALRSSRILKSLLLYVRKSPELYVRKLTDIRQIMDSVVTLLKYRVESRDIELIYDQTTELPDIYCFPDKVQEIFVNLLVNAIDSMENCETQKLGIDFSVNNHTIVTRISDTGPGIPPDVQEQMFDPFYTTKEVGKGTGLGLPIVKGIVEEHNGVLTFETSAKGTVFAVSLPIIDGEIHEKSSDN